MEAPLRVTQRTAAGVSVLALEGRLVYDEGDRIFKEAVTGAVAAGARRILVDLRAVEYMDSGGVGSLVAMYLHVLRRSGQLKLLCPSERATRILRITHLLTVFEVFEDEAAALQSYSGNEGVEIENSSG